MHEIRLLSACVLGLSWMKPAIAAAPISDSDRVETIASYAKGLVKRAQVPGLAIAVVRNGRTFQTVTQGVSDENSGTAVTADTPFQLASTTKIFSSTAVLRLVADGKLRLDDPIGRHLEGLPSEWRKVTVAQLLSHTSGLPDIALRPGQRELVAADWPGALKILASKPLPARPGTQWAYNQTNYALLLRLVEHVSGKSFEAFLHQRLFTPLNMRQTFYPTAKRRCATNYESDTAGKLVVRDLSFPAYVHAAAGLCSSLNDLVTWARAMDQGKLLPVELTRLAQSPVTLADGSKLSLGGTASYGLGRALDTDPKHGWAGHSGGNSTAFRQYPGDRMAIIVLHNGMMNPDVIADRLARTMLAVDKAGQAQADLWDAAGDGDEAALTKALDAGADVNALDTRSSRSGRRPLNWAAVNNHSGAIRLLLSRGADLNAQNLSGFTALHHAAEEGAIDALRALLGAGARTDILSKSGATAAEVARANGHEEIAKLIEAAAKHQ